MAVKSSNTTLTLRNSDESGNVRGDLEVLVIGQVGKCNGPDPEKFMERVNYLIIKNNNGKSKHVAIERTQLADFFELVDELRKICAAYVLPPF